MKQGSIVKDIRHILHDGKKERTFADMILASVALAGVITTLLINISLL